MEIFSIARFNDINSDYRTQDTDMLLYAEMSQKTRTYHCQSTRTMPTDTMTHRTKQTV